MLSFCPAGGKFESCQRKHFYFYFYKISRIFIVFFLFPFVFFFLCLSFSFLFLLSFFFLLSFVFLLSFSLLLLLLCHYIYCLLICRLFKSRFQALSKSPISALSSVISLVRFRFTNQKIPVFYSFHLSFHSRNRPITISDDTGDAALTVA